MTEKKKLYTSTYVGWLMTIVPHKLEALYQSGELANKIEEIVEDTITEEQHLINTYSLNVDEARLRAFQKYMMPGINHPDYEDQKKYPKMSPEELVTYSRRKSTRYLEKTYKPIFGGSRLLQDIFLKQSDIGIAQAKALMFWQNKQGDFPLVLQVTLSDFLVKNKLVKAKVLCLQAAREMYVLPTLFELRDLTLNVSDIKVNAVQLSYHKSSQVLFSDTRFLLLKKEPYKEYTTQINYKPMT